MPAPIPSAGTELDALGKFIVARLVASSGFLSAMGDLAGSPNMTGAEAKKRIHADVCPDGGPFPQFVYTVQFAPSVVGAGGHSIAQRATVAAKIVVKNRGYGEASATVAAMSEALTGEDASAEIDGWDVSAYRQEHYRYSEVVAKDIYRHVGIMLEGWVSAIP